MDKLNLAQNPKTPTEVLDRLANDNHPDIRYVVALNPNTSPETLERLASDEDPDVRVGVAKNPNTPPETLERLANDEDYWVRNRVAKNPNTAQYIRTYLKIRQFLNWHKDVGIQENLVYSEIQDELDNLILVQHEATQYEN